MAMVGVGKLWQWPFFSKHFSMKARSSIWRSWQATITGLNRGSDNSQHDAHVDKLENPSKPHATARRAFVSIGWAVVLALKALASLIFLLRYLLPRQGRPVRQKAFHELHPMSYLDALRGYLALIIFTGHTMSRRWRWIPNSVLAIPWLQFPFRGGHASLDIFFWISGYAITYRIVGFMQARKSDKVLDTLASSIFRRYLRLFLPMAITTFFTTIALATGLAVTPPHKKNIFVGNLFVLWVKDTAQAINPFAQVGSWWTLKDRAGSDILDQFWSINTEFRSSMIMFTFCTATCKMSSSRRKWLIWLCIPVLLAWQVQWLAMAFLGMWFAECRQQKAREKLVQKSLITAQPVTAEGASIPTPSQDTEKDKYQNEEQTKAATIMSRSTQLFGRITGPNQRQSVSRLRQPFLLAIFLYSFCVMKDPHENHTYKTFPHNIINFFALKHWAPEMKMHFHLLIGGCMMLYPLDQIQALQRPLLTPFSRWLGELSFGIYAVHITVRWIWWEPRYLKWMSARYGREFDHFWILFPGYVVMTLMVLWGADLFRRMDARVVNFCRDLELKLFE